jgi:hypothetical protein
MSILTKPTDLPSSSDDRIRQLEKSIEMLIAKVASLEIEVSTLKKGTPKEDEEVEVEDEEVQTPPKRLLRR